MAISLVGTSATTVASGVGNQSITLPGTEATDDIVQVVINSDATVGDGTDGNGGIQTTGYTDIHHDAGDASPGYQFAYKRLGATPDSAVVIAEGGDDQNVLVQVWRGVDTTTAIDTDPPTTASGSGTMPNSPSYTTTTDNAQVFSAGSLDDDDAGTVTAPSGYGDLEFLGATGVGTAMVASVLKVTAGAEDPGIFGGTTSGDPWQAATWALRPAVAVGANPKGPFGMPFGRPFQGPFA